MQSRNHNVTMRVSNATAIATSGLMLSACRVKAITTSGKPKNATPTVCKTPVRVNTMKMASTRIGCPNAANAKKTTETSQAKLDAE